LHNQTSQESYDFSRGRFKVQSESRKSGKGKYVVRLNKEDRYLMNGYNYGWVLKEHCEVIEI